MSSIFWFLTTGNNLALNFEIFLTIFFFFFTATEYLGIRGAFLYHGSAPPIMPLLALIWEGGSKYPGKFPRRGFQSSKVWPIGTQGQVASGSIGLYYDSHVRWWQTHKWWPLLEPPTFGSVSSGAVLRAPCRLRYFPYLIQTLFSFDSTILWLFYVFF
jgi:hypothetical protein